MSIWRESRAAGQQNQQAPTVSRQSAASAHVGEDLEFGERVGEYVIIRKLGEGGFGSVYEALHPVIGKRAAVKVLHAQYSSDASVTSRFTAEARAVNQIKHKNIVDIFSFGELSDHRHYYVMELLEGVPLDVYLERAGHLDVAEALALLGEIARAVQAAHDAGIAHRDLKPENVFLELDEQCHVCPKILDFGMAKLLSGVSLPIHKTNSGTPIGSPRYMSPEQCRGVQVDHRADIYSFGGLAYRMLAGHAPFEAGTALELMMAHVSAPPVPLSSTGTDLGPEFDEALLKMLEKLPEHRPQTMLQAFESLRNAAGFDKDWAGMPLSATTLLLEMAEARRRASIAVDVTQLHRSQGDSGVVTVSSRKPWAWPAVIAGTLLVAYFIAQVTPSMRQKALPMPTASTPVAAALAATSGPPAAEASASASLSQAHEVNILVNTQPARAELFVNDEKVAMAPGPLHLPPSDSPQLIVVKAPGYQVQNVTVVPTSDKTLHVTLMPLKTRSNPRVSQDLENPY
ncbi:MAG TPA: serine/threonine-protein kinase [Polyangiaceae bacterium]